MSQPPQNAQNQAIQIQIASSINAQTGIFQQMNALLRTMNSVVAQLNTGFKALTQAIMQNTAIMAKLSIVGPLGTLFNLTNMWKGKGNGPTQLSLDTLTALEAAFQKLNQPLENLIGTIQTQLIPTTNNATTTVKKKGFWKGNETLDMVKQDWGQIGSLINPFKAAKQGFQTAKADKLASGSFTQGAGNLAGAGGAVLGFIKSSIAGPFQAAGKMISPFTSALSSMGPQMMALALISAPVTEFLNAFLEPLSMLSDYFSGFGSILSQILIPVMIMIQPLLDAITNLLQTIVPLITPLITQLFQLTGIGMLTQILIPLMPLITSLIGLIASLAAAFAPLLSLVTSLIPILMTALIPAITMVADWITTLTNWIIQNVGAIEKAVHDAVNAVSDWWAGVGNTTGWW